MAFTIKPDGTITVDTVDELRDVLTVREQVASKAKQEPKVAAPSNQREPLLNPVELFRPSIPAPDLDVSFRKMYEHASDSPQQQRFMRLLVTAPPRMFSDDQLRSELGLESNIGLRGLLIGIVRRANSRALPSPIVKQMTRFARNKRAYRYGATGEFRRAMEGYRFEDKVAV
jgi:hypothetical protein